MDQIIPETGHYLIVYNIYSFDHEIKLCPSGQMYLKYAQCHLEPLHKTDKVCLHKMSDVEIAVKTIILFVAEISN